MSANIENNNDAVDMNYSTVSVFFGISDLYRLIVNILAIISFVLNSIIMFITCNQKKDKVYSLSGILTWNILLFNFLHTCSYIINWFTKFGTENEGINIGYLLFNTAFCKIQAFCLIFFSISQDILMNVLFSYVIFEEKNRRYLFFIILGFAGYFFPFMVTIFFYRLDILGIDEQYCYISKYFFLEDQIESGKEIEYITKHNISYYIYYKIIIAMIRGINFFISFIFIIKAIKYIKRNERSKKEKKEKPNKKKERIRSFLPLVFIGFTVLFFYLVFEIISIIKSEFGATRTRIYLIINCLESVLLPFAFSYKHNIYIYLFCPKNPGYAKNTNENDTSFEIDPFLKEMKENNDEN
jgi:hypothetical protein